MNEANKILRKLLSETSLQPKSITPKNSAVAAIVVHPITGHRAEFVVSACGTRNIRSIANLRSRIRRFERIGCDLFAGQSHPLKQKGKQASNK